MPEIVPLGNAKVSVSTTVPEMIGASVWKPVTLGITTCNVPLTDPLGVARVNVSATEPETIGGAV